MSRKKTKTNTERANDNDSNQNPKSCGMPNLLASHNKQDERDDYCNEGKERDHDHRMRCGKIKRTGNEASTRSVHNERG